MEKDKIEINPNPAIDFIEIKTNGYGITNFRIYDCLGQLIPANTYYVNGNLQNIKIDFTSHYEPGLYFIRIDGKILNFIKI